MQYIVTYTKQQANSAVQCISKQQSRERENSRRTTASYPGLVNLPAVMGLMAYRTRLHSSPFYKRRLTNMLTDPTNTPYT
jgi:hypothetical protein